MNPSKVKRSEIVLLTDLPNVGKSIAADLVLLGIVKPDDLRGKDGWSLYEKLCFATKQFQDPCLLDVLISLEDFTNGKKAKPWWDFTEPRKMKYAKDIEKLRANFN